MLQQAASVRLAELTALRGADRLQRLLELARDLDQLPDHVADVGDWEAEWAAALQGVLRRRLDALCDSGRLSRSLAGQLQAAVTEGPLRIEAVALAHHERRLAREELRRQNEASTLRLRCLELRVQCFQHLITIFTAGRAG